MKFDSKIDHMLASGKLTKEQAQALKLSLKNQIGSDTTYHAPLPAKMMLAGAAFLAVVLIGFSMTGAEAPVQEIQNVSEILNQSGKVGEMNKSLTSVLSIVIIGLPALIWFVMSYNSLVTKEEDVLSAWAQVETNYQRRADLIPNLVNTVKAFTDHEGQTMTDIARLRSQTDSLQQENIKAKEMSQGSAAHLEDDAYMESLAKTQQGVSGQIRDLMLSVESYPALRSSDQYLELQAQIEGTENRINVARMAFNEKVNEFNSSIRRMPNSLLAGMGHFQRKAYFKADEGTDKATRVDFGSPSSQAAE